ncbi:MAG TPA: phosphotransferase family protein [Gammaproteobacteria bacterium]|nr:phosphotransferase family protein [Gammaproteobacteria bacterium]
MKSRTELFTGTQEVREQHQFEIESLERYMLAHVEGFKGPIAVDQFRGGQSNPTYRLTTPKARYVLRRKPPGTLLKSAHAVDREYRMLVALQNSKVPAARPFALCLDESIIGSAFYVMEHVEGRVFWDHLIPEFGNAQRAALYDHMNEVLAELHLLDYESLGLGDFGKPGNYFARQIGRWTKQYRASQTDTIAEMDKLIEWLPNNIPADESSSIVHGDYRLENMIIHPTAPRIVAVLDWELSTIGHPLGDLTYQCTQWRLPHTPLMNGIQGVDRKAYGIPTEEEYIATYCRRTGRRAIENWDFYMAYNLFRLAAIVQGIVGRIRDGTASSKDASTMSGRVRPMAEMAWAIVRG